MNKIRLHIPGLPHTITSNEYSHCAFTGKILRFAPMMMSRGFEVYHYGVEGSESVATKNIDLLTRTEWDSLRIESYQYLHKDKCLSEEQTREILQNKKTFIGDLANYQTILYKKFNESLRTALLENYRNPATDIFCIPFGRSYTAATDGLHLTCVETGIGYQDSYEKYRIFESYCYLHVTMAIEKKQCQHYWFVIPNYYNVLEWPLQLNPDNTTVGFFGRICHIKGCNIFAEIAKKFPHIHFLICGQGDPEEYIKSHPNIIYQEPIDGLARGKYLGKLAALIAPSLYIEPFCGVNVEAQLCGTPVITNDCGAFTETIENYKTGLLCHTLADFCKGVQMAIDGKFDRQYIHDRADRLYNMYNVAHKYEYTFRTILEVHNGNNGWYSPISYL